MSAKETKRSNKQVVAPKAGCRWTDAALVVMAAAVSGAVLLSNRLLAAGGLVRTMNVVLIVAGVLATFLVPRPRFDWLRGWLRSLWPLFGLLAVDTLVRLITAFRLSPYAGINARYFFYALLPILALSAAVLIGYVLGENRPSLAGWVFGVSIGVALFFALAEWAAGAGFSNPIESVLRTWDESVRALGRVWAPAVGGEAFRAIGLETDPNYLGALGVGVLVWALAARAEPALRVGVGLASASVLMLSASRTAVLGAGLALGAVAVFEATRSWKAGRDSEASDTTSGADVGPGAKSPLLKPSVLVAGALVLVVVLAVTAGGVGERLAESSRLASEIVSSADSTQSALFVRLDAFTNGRLVRWAQGIEAWKRYPLGAFMLPDVVIGTHVHDEYLERLVWGGPLMLACFMFVLVWLAVKFRPKSAPAYGLAASLAWATIALALAATHLPAFATLIFFGVGFTAGSQR